METVLSGDAAWLGPFNDRANEAAILARQNVKIAACNAAASLILDHPNAVKVREKIDDGKKQHRVQSAPIYGESGGPIVVGRIFQIPKFSLRRSLASGGMDLMFARQTHVYSRAINEDDDPLSQPVLGRPDTAILPVAGVRPHHDLPNSVSDGSLRGVPYTDDNITRFSHHVAIAAFELDVPLPTGNEFVGITRAVRLG